MVFIFGDANIFLNTPNDPQHGWMAYILAGIGGLVLIVGYLQIYRLNGQSPLTTISGNCFGKFAGGAVSLLYALFFMVDAALTAYNYTSFIILSNYVYTPEWFIQVTLCVITLYALFKGIKVIGRTAEIFAWLILFAFIFVNVFDATAMKPNNIFPIRVTKVSPVIKDAFYPLMLYFGGTVAFLMLFPLTGDVNKIKKPLYTGVSIVTLILTFQTLRVLLVLGGSMINRYVYGVHLSYFIGYPVKLEIIPDTTVSLSVLIKVIVLLYASVTIMGNVFHAKKISPFIIAVTLAAFLISYFSMPNGFTLNEFFQGIWVYIIAVFAVFIPAILLVISLIRNCIKRRMPVLMRK